MSLACRFCHSAAEAEHRKQLSYAVVVSHVTGERLMEAIEVIERECKEIPGCCVRCETCGRHSVISYSSAVFVAQKYGMEGNGPRDFYVHYQEMCRIHERKKRVHYEADATQV